MRQAGRAFYAVHFSPAVSAKMIFDTAAIINKQKEDFHEYILKPLRQAEVQDRVPADPGSDPSVTLAAAAGDDIYGTAPGI